MGHKIAFEKFAQLSQRYYLLLFFSVGLLVTNLLLGFGVLHALKQQKHEIIPFGATKGYVISDSGVDAHYLDLMTQNFIYSRLNISPSNVTEQHQRLLSFVEPSIYADFKKQLRLESDLVQKKKISSTFDIEVLHSDPDELVSEVRGVLHRHVGYQELPTHQKTYQLHYRYRLGSLHLVSFVEVKEEQ